MIDPVSLGVTLAAGVYLVDKTIRVTKNITSTVRGFFSGRKETELARINAEVASINANNKLDVTIEQGKIDLAKEQIKFMQQVKVAQLQGFNQEKLEILKSQLRFQELQWQATQKNQDEKLRAELQQNLAILNGQIEREYLLLKYSEERKLAFEKFESDLQKDEYLAMIANVWPLTLPPREYNKLSAPNSEGQVSISILIDNRTPNSYGALCSSLWDELDICLSESFRGGCPYYFNSNIFSEHAKAKGAEISVLHTYSKHIPTLVLVPKYSDKELVIDLEFWGLGKDKKERVSFSIPVAEQLIEIARAKITELAEIYDDPEDASPVFVKYWDLFKKEKAKFENGKTKDQLLKIGFYNSLIKVDSKGANEIQSEVFCELAKYLAHEVFLPVGQIIDVYASEEFGLASRLPFILKLAVIEDSQRNELLFDYVQNLVNDVRSGQSMIGKEQLEEFIRNVEEAGFDKQEEVNKTLEELTVLLKKQVDEDSRPKPTLSEEDASPQSGKKKDSQQQSEESAPQTDEPEDAQAQYELGKRYQSGEDVDQDDEEAAKWFLKAAEQGYAEAQLSLGKCYYFGWGVKEDREEAVKWYRKAAEQGVAEAQIILGTCYFNGWGVKTNEAEAVKWYRKAAEQGYAEAQYELGQCYFNGWGVPENCKKAVKLFHLAADQEYVDAYFDLGLAYRYGNGVDEDKLEALKWFRKAAEQGCRTAQSVIAEMYENDDWDEDEDEDENDDWDEDEDEDENDDWDEDEDEDENDDWDEDDDDDDWDDDDD